MKQGIILARKHGGKELTALGPSLPYDKAKEFFKKEFQTGENTHAKYEEVALVPVESGVAKRVRFFTEKRAAELDKIHAEAHEAAKKAAALSDEIKAALADIADANNQIGHFERGLEHAEKTLAASKPDTDDRTAKAKHVSYLADRIKSAKAQLERAQIAFKNAEAKNKKADAEADAKAEAKTPTEKSKEQ